jgi:hypothetical protein
VAANCWFVPNTIDGFPGVTAIETRAAGATVRVVDPLTVPELAATVVVPTPVPVARPPLEIVATPCDEELHVTVLVRSCVLPSVYVPVAVNWLLLPKIMVGIAGVTVIESNAAALTVYVVEPLIPPELAVMIVCPAEALLAKPVLLRVAMLGLEEIQVVVLVMS